jgi:hypothetical protein
MARYTLNLPAQLKQDAETWAARQGVSLNQFILWAVAEKVGSLSTALMTRSFRILPTAVGRVASPRQSCAGQAFACRRW